MRFAYADPPYFGYAAKFYADRHPNAADYDHIETHKALIERLSDEFPDGWALSMTSGNLKDILPLCPEDCRVAAWVKPFCSFKPNVNPAFAWEPVVFRGGREEREGATTRDYCAVPITLKTGLVGAKPEGFSFWLFDLLGMRPSDEFVDIFPGSGAVGRAWERWRGGLFAMETRG